MGKRRTLLAAAVSAGLITSVTGTVLAGEGDNTAEMAALQVLVKEQQNQLNEQAAEIAQLKEKLDALIGMTSANKEAIAGKADKADVAASSQTATVVSGNPDVKVSLYGQVNRAALWADNGDSSETYFVDNINSSSRMGIVGSAQATEDLSIGGKFEFELVSNASTEVNQLEGNTSASMNIRHADVFFDSGTWGKLYLGQGSTSTDGTAERDLSGTNVVAYSAVQYMAGGQLWYDDAGQALSEYKITSVIDNMDGLSRRDRIRYDSPSLAGFQLSGSAIETGAFDTALLYSRSFSGLKVAGSLGYATPGDLASWDNQYDGSLSLLLDNGLNFTIAGGARDAQVDDRDDPVYWYGKIGYQTQLFSSGLSAVSVDYGQWNDLAANDDEATSLGVAMVQNFAKWGTEVYLAYRLYQLDRPGMDFADVNAVTGGARVKF